MHVLLSWQIYLQTMSVNACSVFWQVLLLQSGSVMSHDVNVHPIYYIILYYIIIIIILYYIIIILYYNYIILCYIMLYYIYTCNYCQQELHKVHPWCFIGQLVRNVDFCARVVLQRRLFGWWLLPLQVQCSDRCHGRWGISERCGSGSVDNVLLELDLNLEWKPCSQDMSRSIFCWPSNYSWVIVGPLVFWSHRFFSSWGPASLALPVTVVPPTCDLMVEMGNPMENGDLSWGMLQFSIRWCQVNTSHQLQQVPSRWMFPPLRRGRRLPGRNLCASGNNCTLW